MSYIAKRTLILPCIVHYKYSYISYLLGPSEPILHINRATATTVFLTWKMPSRPNGIIRQYELQYQRIGSRKTMTQSTNGRKLTDIVTGLIGDTEYQFIVRAFTRAGAGPWSDAVAGRTGECNAHVMHLHIIHHWKRHCDTKPLTFINVSLVVF